MSLKYFTQSQKLAILFHPSLCPPPGMGVSLNVIGAISPRGHLRFMVVKGTVISDHICDFLTIV